MADPPPPSYDDAIAGNYSAPPLNPSPSPLPAGYNGPEKYRMPEGIRPFPSPSQSYHPPSQSPSALQPSYPPPSQSPSTPQPSAPSLSEQETIPLASRRDERETEENDVNSESTSNKESCLRRSFSITWKLLLLGAIVGLITLFYLMFISSKADVQNNCRQGPPYFRKSTWSNCTQDINELYLHGGQCELKCDKNYRFFIEDDYYYGPVYIECVDSEWIPPASSPIPCTKHGIKMDQHKIDLERTCGRCKLDTSSPDVCKIPPPSVVGGQYYDDPFNARHEYFSGTTMSFRCNGDRVIERPRRKCLNERAPDFTIKMTGLSRCDDSHNVPPATEGEYTCTRGKWVSSFHEIGGTNKTIECIAPVLSPGSCGMEPPKISKATWIDCQERREFRNGEKCNFKCNGNYISSSSKRVGADKYDREGYYTCTQGRWRNHLYSYVKLKCLTITEWAFGKSQK